MRGIRPRRLCTCRASAWRRPSSSGDSSPDKAKCTLTLRTSAPVSNKYNVYLYYTYEPLTRRHNNLRPLLYTCGCIGHAVPVWDCHHEFGDTSLLVDSTQRGRIWQTYLGARPAALMRGYGSVAVGCDDLRLAVYITYYPEAAAKLQMRAMVMGEVTSPTRGEIDQALARIGPFAPIELGIIAASVPAAGSSKRRSAARD